MKNFLRTLKQIFLPEKDDVFLGFLENIEVIVSKVLSLAMVCVIIFAVFDLIIFISQQLFFKSNPLFKDTLFEIFGLFLNILIALEILENITAYLRKHVFQVELVIATSLIAVARKIIIFDIDKKTGQDLIGLGFAIIALSISFWIIRSRKNR
ncbi:MAG: phosphate-starvation-inducible PsiE family protein [Microcoleaceae cyanobacterium MO_207.B10]|nr:phosphate-starvation-inducible PsiE family protein [Microcoleaceae cyanobacterium MO_207.B10]